MLPYKYYAHFWLALLRSSLQTKLWSFSVSDCIPSFVLSVSATVQITMMIWHSCLQIDHIFGHGKILLIGSPIEILVLFALWQLFSVWVVPIL